MERQKTFFTLKKYLTIMQPRCGQFCWNSLINKKVNLNGHVMSVLADCVG